MFCLQHEYFGVLLNNGYDQTVSMTAATISKTSRVLAMLVVVHVHFVLDMEMPSQLQKPQQGGGIPSITSTTDLSYM